MPGGEMSDEKQIIKKLRALEKSGVEFVSTDGVVISDEVIVEPGAVIYPGTVIEGASRIGAGAVIGPDAFICDCEIGAGVRINSSQCFSSRIGAGSHVGPYAHVRPDCDIGEGVKIGSFVEMKSCRVGDNSSFAHLCYLGDAEVGRDVTFGCGAITVNFDGVKKSRTIIGERAFIGCNCNLIAPVVIGKDAFVAAGTSVTGEVLGGALAIGRAETVVKEGWVERHFNKK